MLVVEHRDHRWIRLLILKDDDLVVPEIIRDIPVEPINQVAGDCIGFILRLAIPFLVRSQR